MPMPQAPAKIVRTQKIHLKEVPVTCMNPEQIGARAGPAAKGGRSDGNSRDGSVNPTLTEGHERKDGHRISTTVRTPQIGDDTAGVGKRSGGEASAEETEDDERTDVGREGASDLEACG